MGYFTIDRWVISQLMEVAIVLPMTPTGQSLAVKDQRLTWGFWPQNMVFLLIKNWWGKLYSFTNKIMNLPIYFSLFFHFRTAVQVCTWYLCKWRNWPNAHLCTAAPWKSGWTWFWSWTDHIYIYIWSRPPSLHPPPLPPPMGWVPR